MRQAYEPSSLSLNGDAVFANGLAQSDDFSPRTRQPKGGLASKVAQQSETYKSSDKCGGNLGDIPLVRFTGGDGV
jgi:hypothetical protein